MILTCSTSAYHLIQQISGIMFMTRHDGNGSYTHTSEETEREATLAVERAIYGNLFSTVLNSENKNSGGSIQ